jgi:hypothetical protein
MPAFLAAISVKDWLYALAFILLVCGFAYEREHLIHEGAQRAAVADAKLAAAVLAKNKAIEGAAQAASNQIGVIYEKAVAVPPVGDLGVVCHAPRSNRVPEAAASGPVAAGAAPVVGDGATYDPTGPALTVGRDDDALIRALQDEVRALLDAMNGRA